jgi:hypothetical protein
VIELKIHASNEEETFYPTVRKQAGAERMNEADEGRQISDEERSPHKDDPLNEFCLLLFVQKRQL